VKPEDFAAICRKGPERRTGDQKKRTRNGVPVRSGSKRTLSIWADTPIAVHGFERESWSSAPTRAHVFCVVYTAWAKKPGLLGEEVDKLRNSCYRIFVMK